MNTKGNTHIVKLFWITYKITKKSPLGAFFFEQLVKLGVELVSVCDGLDTTTPTGRAMFKMIGVIAELEREMIVERTKAGLAASRARGRKGGRPKTDSKKIERALKLYDSQEHSIADIETMTGVKKATLYRELNIRKGKLSKVK